MKNLKKVLAVVMAVAMLFALSATVFAATSDPNMTNDSSQWVVYVAPGSSVFLYACPANAYFDPTGFSGNATSNDVEWTSGNTAIATVDSWTFDEEAPFTSLYGKNVSRATITVPLTATVGSTSITCKNTITNASVNFSIIVNSNITQDVEDVSVYIIDFAYQTVIDEVDHSTQHFATPVDAMSIIDADQTAYIDIVYNGIYIPKMSYYGIDFEEQTDYEGGEYIYYGWNYRVYRQNGNDSTLVPDSVTMSVNAFQLQDNDTIVWLYGTPEMAEDMFCDSLADLMNSLR